MCDKLFHLIIWPANHSLAVLHCNTIAACLYSRAASLCHQMHFFVADIMLRKTIVDITCISKSVITNHSKLVISNQFNNTTLYYNQVRCGGYRSSIYQTSKSKKTI